MNQPQFTKNARFWKIFHGVRVIFYILLWIAAAVFGWIYSVAFVAHVSMIALVEGAMAAWQGARTEKKEEDNV
jgi:membrane associated rhomboid family serine protease